METEGAPKCRQYSLHIHGVTIYKQDTD